ncbi:YybH family protein [Mycolicibacterium gilvum]|uniref:SnoaL-like domain n=1 Tax=Mycolicibacterium gilvum TaxID=1804 RepID=A0A378SGP5_9MYCO|nr:nuclear transport factor 2 family protein [Mycolicibacterium gilvum]MCV7056020.1 nuclear transport factor 2 family protein [Mycolicibacterium gilvum]STZ41036.1 SnoaL-like domain [Mycolicibacterium gilvum]
MSDDQRQIRDTVERWVEAIRARDLDGVLAAHTDDLVMFDVPPPYDGIRGMDAYRDSWPPFFDFLAGGAQFELVELDVVAGETAGFAYALLRCGRPEDFEAEPDVRLRITMGLRKVDGRWLITHEHHSFPIKG